MRQRVGEIPLMFLQPTIPYSKTLVRATLWLAVEMNKLVLQKDIQLLSTKK